MERTVSSPDVGSVKSVIHEKVTELGLEGRFIGGHPRQAPNAAVFPIPVIIFWKMLIISSLREEKLLWKRFSDFTELISSLCHLPCYHWQKNMI